MGDAFAGALALDDVGGLEKLLDLFLGERFVVSSQRQAKIIKRRLESSRIGVTPKLPVRYARGRLETALCLRRRSEQTWQ